MFVTIRLATLRAALRSSMIALGLVVAFSCLMIPLANAATEMVERPAQDSSKPAGHQRKNSHQPVDFNGVWEMTDISIVTVPEDDVDNFTDLAKQRIKDIKENYDPSQDDPAFFCLAKGMPWAMLNRARNYPTEIYQTDDRVMVLFELYDAYRSIRLDVSDFPEYVAPSAHGYSIGHWEGDALVIETRDLMPTNPVSLPYIHRSEEARIIERWTLQSHPKFGEVFINDMTIDDPVIYKKPATAHFVMKRAPKGTVLGGYNCPQDAWDRHVKKRQKEMASQKSAKESHHGEP
ncbi:MAG: hypothetical protein AB7I12_04165 [Steroidobacteraceae bacterium]